MPGRRDVVRLRAAIFGVLAACGGGQATVVPPPPAGPTCASAAEHMVDEMAATKDPRPPDETLNGLIELIRTRCEQDAWSSQAISCLSKITSAADADQCGTLLTDAQQAALVKDQAERSKQ